ncbi:MAG: cobalamin-dependent protein [Leptospiraceae bacterium]|nr:cobalamin-dependent protein [Leptospiraceae bacterium]
MNQSSSQEQVPLAKKHHLRCVTAAALFDGHDAAINIMRRIMQASGIEVIHLGHNRSAAAVAAAALQEDVHFVAISSYQGGHIEYFKYLRDLLNQGGGAHIQIYGGGGGVIVADEIEELHRYGIQRIFSPTDGQQLGLQGMINQIIAHCDADIRSLGPSTESLCLARPTSDIELARLLTLVEGEPALINSLDWVSVKAANKAPVLGITGPGGAGKSSLTDELCQRFLRCNAGLRIAMLAVDPTRRKTGGSLLGDRIRLNSPDLYPGQIFVRSVATRGSGHSLTDGAQAQLQLLNSVNFDLIILESSGIGQSDDHIHNLVDLSLYVMTAEFGAPTQLEKIAMLDYADLVALNKAEKQGSVDALQYVKKQVQRNHQRFQEDLEGMPVYATIASRFNDPGVDTLYNQLIQRLQQKSGMGLNFVQLPIESDTVTSSPGTSRSGGAPGVEIVPESRKRYLSEIADTVRQYHTHAAEQSKLVERYDALTGALEWLAADAAQRDTAGIQIRSQLAPEGPESAPGRDIDSDLEQRLSEGLNETAARIDPQLLAWLENWPALKQRYHAAELSYTVRDREFRQTLFTDSLAGLSIPLVATPPYQSWTELARFYYKENLPGFFPFTASVFPFRKPGEDPTRMFAGEGGSERTNLRFHYLTRAPGQEPAGDRAGSQTAAAAPSVARLSTAFDSVTLYGEDPAERPDIYGKIGNSGVSVPTLDDCKRLYSGFDLMDPGTSVSMTINGPAPIVLAFFLNAAIDQQVEKVLRERGELDQARATIAAHYQEKGLALPRYESQMPGSHNGLGLALLGMSSDRLIDAQSYQEIKRDVLANVRGTVQADILKEDQAQNTCIFSTPFALRLMGDIQEYFIEHQVRNFYSVSISGYHIAEAGANPITQLAFTLANGFTYVEYYLSRGLPVDAFAPNLSFFFSNGLDPEYAVIGRVARRIWAVAMRRLYQANDRSQKLKYHIQTSGRSLHAQEVDFNDIRTTLQALYALYDNCNSLHTNAYDEAVTTPTEESVRRAMAIQLIINRELGQNKNQNSLQGSYLISELTDLVEEAVLAEFDRLTARGGVLAAMESMYQRAKIQEESLHYEHLKHSGELPIIGVNTWLSENAAPSGVPELIRSTTAEKQQQIERVNILQRAFPEEAQHHLGRLRSKIQSGANSFTELMEAVKYCSLGQISAALYSVGGSYRRSM